MNLLLLLLDETDPLQTPSEDSHGGSPSQTHSTLFTHNGRSSARCEQRLSELVEMMAPNSRLASAFDGRTSRSTEKMSVPGLRVMLQVYSATCTSQHKGCGVGSPRKRSYTASTASSTRAKCFWSSVVQA